MAEALEQRFGVPLENNMAEQLKGIADQLISEYWTEHKRDICDIIDGRLSGGRR